MLRCNFVVIAISLFVTACAPIGQQKPTEISSADLFWEQRYPPLVQLHHWEIRGRAAIVQGKEGWNAGLVWREYNGPYQIKLQGPFAQGGVVLDGDNEKAVLTMADGQQISSTDSEALITEVLKIQLPVNALRYWVRGVPYSEKNFETIEFDEDGRIIKLLQQGWQIEFSRYVSFKQYSMPSKIFIKKDDHNLRIIIHHWEKIE